MTPGDLPRFGQWTGGASRQTSLEADEAENANPKIIVQRQQGCEPLTRSNIAKPQVVIAGRVLGDDMVAIGSVDARECWLEVNRGKFPSLGIAVRRSDKNNGGRQELGPPDRRAEACWLVGIADERTTPSDGKFPSWRLPP